MVSEELPPLDDEFQFGLSTRENVDGQRKEIKKLNNQGILDTVERIAQ